MPASETVIMPDVQPQPETLAETEATLARQIIAHCAAHRKGKLTVRRPRDEMKSARHQLGEKLHSLKAILSHSGRSGQWASYLRSAGLAKTSADRYIAGYVETINPPEKNGPTGAVPEPAEDATSQFIKQIMSKIRKALTTRDAVWIWSASWWNCQ
jgi:hypothetical protein